MTLAAETGSGHDTGSRRFGGQSMTAPLREALVKAPGPAFGQWSHSPAGEYSYVMTSSRKFSGVVVTAKRGSTSDNAAIGMSFRTVTCRADLVEDQED